MGKEAIGAHAWLKNVGRRRDLLGERSQLGLLAIAEHYSAKTCLLNVTSSVTIAEWFAFHEHDMPNTGPFVRILASPHHSAPAVSYSGMGIIVVDLTSELPSYCLRPHLQSAAFLAWQDLAEYESGHSQGVNVDRAYAAGSMRPLEIARVELCGTKARFPGASLPIEFVTEPIGSDECKHCGPKDVQHGDLLRHYLACEELDPPCPWELK